MSESPLQYTSSQPPFFFNCFENICTHFSQILLIFLYWLCHQGAAPEEDRVAAAAEHAAQEDPGTQEGEGEPRAQLRAGETFRLKNKNIPYFLCLKSTGDPFVRRGRWRHGRSLVLWRGCQQLRPLCGIRGEDCFRKIINYCQNITHFQATDYGDHLTNLHRFDDEL